MSTKNYKHRYLNFYHINGNVHAWFPFYDVFTTKELMVADLAVKIPGFILTAVAWAFFEGFNYVVISRKINDRYISKNKWLNYGAIVCGLICILIHGMLGFDLYTIFEAITTFIIIYGMLVIKENTNNAWGCILIFLFFWNAI